MVLWDDLGFATDYGVEPDVEYPGDGTWDYPVVELDQGLGVPTPAAVAIIRPDGSVPWVLAVGFAQFGALYATPNPSMIAVLDQYAGVLLVDTLHPEIQHELDTRAPVSVAGMPDEGVLLVVSGWNFVSAYDASGDEKWSRYLDLSDLHILRADNGWVQCRGFDRAGSPAPTVVVLDARTGEVV